ncbi:hypothetical protein H5410_030576 [Solanum commersonii]|uniref:Uncharacterized protein n=1 Tax=Solanum commersonii TaxID=4109 RepID=A0A9J5YJR7_SOLCO|nr:hypothetical protein H5410_030576 [Solanum commersonii]
MLKTLELDGETYEKVYGLLYTSGLHDDYESDLGSNIELLDLFDNDKNCDSPSTTCQGNTCNCEDDEIYKLQSQFQDFNMNTITSDNVMELMKEVTDNKLCEKIINLANSNEASSSSSKPFENKKNDLNDFEYSAPYSLKEVDNRLIKRNTFPKKYSYFDDLKIEIENLKREIKSLKQNQLICDHRITQIELHNSEDRELVNLDPKQEMFFGMMQIITAYKWYVKCINSKGFSATYKDNEITYSFVTDLNHMDSLQLELVGMNRFDSLKYAKVKEKIKLTFEQNAIDICAYHPSAFWNRKKHIHDASKLIFARWQAQLNPFDFEIQYKKGVDNSLPDFLSREYLQ